ncbi:hypothetical protein DACRYDRAFT_24758 [Dacryopinax primogenitus]|uniref:Uncharacterized protein n=1 Tax=Dacryopinax primogenitus (strain DJM 731) TaxID=1858805 RepID=M5FQJ6_DACPD|nr:uncharacterized protein DACRYDRAFT_24758 [Dacryopinax primogenitus]EJT97773.1 hypothetical protein DACRYDRAFT_24758 [Dacryopinax primogenitus]
MRDPISSELTALKRGPLAYTIHMPQFFRMNSLSMHTIEIDFPDTRDALWQPFQFGTSTARDECSSNLPVTRPILSSTSSGTGSIVPSRNRKILNMKGTLYRKSRLHFVSVARC